MGQVVELRLRRQFDAAHQLPYHLGKCHRLHGHRWQVELCITGMITSDTAVEEGGLPAPHRGMVVDFGDVKTIVDRILPDHLSLNNSRAAEQNSLAIVDEPSVWVHGLENPTAENLAVALFDLLDAALAPLFSIRGVAAALTYVRVWETPDCDVTYRGATP